MGTVFLWKLHILSGYEEVVAGLFVSVVALPGVYRNIGNNEEYQGMWSRVTYYNCSLSAPITMINLISRPRLQRSFWKTYKKWLYTCYNSCMKNFLPIVYFCCCYPSCLCYWLSQRWDGSIYSFFLITHTIRYPFISEKVAWSHVYSFGWLWFVDCRRIYVISTSPVPWWI